MHSREPKDWQFPNQRRSASAAMVPSGNLNEVIGAPQSKSDFRSLPIDINGGLLPLRYLKIDKADQSKTALPSIATMSLGCTVGCPGAVGLLLMTTKIQPTSDLGFLRSCSSRESALLLELWGCISPDSDGLLSGR